MLFSRRIMLGCLCLVAVIIIFVAVRNRIEQITPEQQDYTLEDATLHFETDRTEVWQEGDCVTLQWQAQNISAIDLMRKPTIPVNTMQWCPTQQISFPVFTVHLTKDKSVNLVPFGIYAIRTRLIIALLPLLLLAGWCFGLHRLLASAFERLPETLRGPFSVAGRVQPLLVVLFLGMNAIVLWNAINQSTTWQYDAAGHYANVQVLSQGRLPTAKDSEEFFSPPVPYVIPALAMRVGGFPENVVRKLGQLQNVLVSLLASFVLLNIGRRLQPDNGIPRTIALFLLATLPVYYKSFALMRGEPFVLLFTLLLCDHLLRLTHITDGKPRLVDGLVIGLYGGLILLSRQWGALILVAIAVWWVILLLRQRSTAVRLLPVGVIAGVIAVIIGGAFYVAMAQQTGSVFAFNRSVDNTVKPATFFTGTGNGKLFSYPFAPAYDGQALPILYTETWGDYFGFFHLPRPILSYLMPPSSVSYMARVNVLSLFPTLVLFSGLIFGIYQLIRLIVASPSPQTIANGLFTLCVVISGAGFVWFLATYPSLDADTAKATYILHIFPLICLLTGSLMEKVNQRWPIAFRVVCIGLVLVATHNILMYFSRIS